MINKALHGIVTMAAAALFATLLSLPAQAGSEDFETIRCTGAYYPALF